MTAQGFTIIDDGRVVQASAENGAALVAHAEQAGRPVAVDREAGAAYLGVAASERARRLESLDAPDFSLPDLGGRFHTLSAHRGRKVLLVAHASW